MTPDPRPLRVRLSRPKYLELVRRLLVATPKCECGCGRQAQSVHHLLGGRDKEDVRENLMCLAGDGTRLCHGALTSKMRVWDEGRQVYIDPLEVAHGIRLRLETARLDAKVYIVSKKGQDGLDRLYPPLTS